MNFRSQQTTTKENWRSVLDNIKVLERYANGNKYLQWDWRIIVITEEENWHKLWLMWTIDWELVYDWIIQKIEAMWWELDDVYQEDMRLAMKYDFDYDFLHSFIKYKQI